MTKKPNPGRFAKLILATSVGVLLGVLLIAFIFQNRQKNLRKIRDRRLNVEYEPRPNTSLSGTRFKSYVRIKRQGPPPKRSTSKIVVTQPDSIAWVPARLAWEWTTRGEAILLDLRPYWSHQRRHPKGARSFNAARLADLEITFPDRGEKYILMRYWNTDINRITREFRGRGYKSAFALDMKRVRKDSRQRSRWEIEGLPFEMKDVLYYNSNRIKLKGYDVFLDSFDQNKKLTHFPKPTAGLLLKYRPHVIEHFGYYDEKIDFEEFKERLEGVGSAIGTAAISGNKIWVGFSFYEGEGSEGYGGLGFYDFETGEVGILRHPALLNHSVREVMVTDTAIFVATIGNFELSAGVGNGLIALDKRTLKLNAKVPPGPSTVWHKDGGENIALYYDKPISELLTDHRFISKKVESWEPAELIKALDIGLEAYMIQFADQERHHLLNLKQ